jgi:hypothetical protein
MQAFRPQESQSFVEFKRRYVVDLSLQCDLCLPESVHVVAERCKGKGKQTSSASLAIMPSIAIRTSFEAIPLPLCSFLTANIAMYPRIGPPR